MSDLREQIETAAGTPKSAEADGISATARSLDELIRADKYLAAKAAAGSKRRGFKLLKFKPPGTA